MEMDETILLTRIIGIIIGVIISLCTCLCLVYCIVQSCRGKTMCNGTNTSATRRRRHVVHHHHHHHHSNEDAESSNSDGFDTISMGGISDHNGAWPVDDVFGDVGGGDSVGGGGSD